jgi:hypothetical protein
LTVNFSAFLAGSGGWVVPAGLTLSFSGTGVAAHTTPEPQKSDTEMMRQKKIDFLSLDSMPPPKPERPLQVKTRVILPKSE